MTFARIVLGLTGLAFAGYGLICLVDPGLVAQSSGMLLPNASALTEVAAMYGGLQTGVGVLFIYCALQPARLGPGLVVLVGLLGSLALGRTIGMLMHGGSTYNAIALVYEALTTALGLLAIRLQGARTAG